ncbi:MAG: DUF2232 domain-containing protein [bacterium]
MTPRQQLLLTPAVLWLGVWVSGLHPLATLMAPAMAIAWTTALLMRVRGGEAAIALAISVAGAAAIPSVRLETVGLVATVATGVGCGWLLRRKSGEDDFFYLPTMAFAGIFVLGVWLSGLVSETDHFGRFETMLHQSLQEALVELKQRAAEKPNLEPALEEWETLSRKMPYYFIGFAAAIFTLLHYGFGLFVRRRLSASMEVERTLPFFRIRERYLIFLILGLVAEIVALFLNIARLEYVAIPLLMVTGVSYFVQGLGVALFHILLRRALGQRLGANVMALLFMVTLFLYFPLVVVLGLLDVWFDFRRLRKPQEAA